MTRLDGPARPQARWWRTYVTEVTDSVESGSADYTATTPPRKAVFKTSVVLFVSALSLTLINFLGRSPQTDQFDRLMTWGAVSIAGYVLLPVLAIKLVLREPLRDFGLRSPGSGRSWVPYLALFALSVPFITLASFQGDFLARYPFYDLAPAESWWPYLWLWWAVYALQFASLEFFFRGFMVHGLKHRLGISSVFVMVVPYAMIHFGKPMPEALAAILGGTVLGFLSLKTGSIWWGVALHIAVAGTMDVLALAHAGLL